MWIPAAQLWGLSPVLRVWRTRGAWVVAADGEHLEGAASQPPDTPRLWALLCSETGIIANPSSLRMKRELAPLAKELGRRVMTIPTWGLPLLELSDWALGSLSQQ